MSENINFIPANELPVAEGNDVSVLCVENGELKLTKAKSTAYDLELRMTGNFSEPEFEVVSGSYDKVREKLLAEEKPDIKAMFVIHDPVADVTSKMWCPVAHAGAYDVDGSEVYLGVLLDGPDVVLWIMLHPDNTIEID